MLRCYQDNALLNQQSTAEKWIFFFLQTFIVWKWHIESVALLRTVLG